MCLTQESDYAIRIIYCLANENARCDAGFISAKMGITLRFSLKILGKLVQGGLVNSFKGNKGGYQLAVPAGQISVKDVIEAVEGEYRLSRCVGDDSGCNRGAAGYCKFHKAFAEISRDVNKRLSEMTFDKFLDEKDNG